MRWSRLGLALGAAAFLGWVVVDLTPAAQLGCGLMLAAVGICTLRTRPRRREVTAVLSLAVSTRYIVWRATDSLGGDTWLDAFAAAVLYAAELGAFVSLIGGLFQTAAFRRRRPVALTGTHADRLPSVDVFIPTYNESVDVVRATALGALAMDYPRKTVWLLDDGRRDAMRRLAAELGCRYLDRPDNQGAKAGNLNAATRRTTGELIAIFDADHVPTRGFLQATVGFFLQDAKLALVQTPHHFINPDPFERNLHLDGRVPPEQHYFYHTIQVGNDFWNSAFFCGSCAVLRRTALVEVGGVPTTTVTEDAACSLMMHARGWNSAYLDVPLAAGLATETFGAHVIQRMRWARGMTQIFRLHNPFLLPGLTWPQRVNYACASWHFIGSTFRMVFLLAAPAYILLDIHPVSADVWELATYALPHLVLIWAAGSDAHRNTRHSFWSEVYETAVAPFTAAVVLLALVAPRRGTFRVTAKGETTDGLSYDWKMATPVVLLLAITAGALLWAPFQAAAHPDEVATLGMAALWCVYNLVLLGASAMVALERPQRRAAHRVAREVTVELTAAGGATTLGRSRDMSLTGASLLLPSGTEPGTVRVTLPTADGSAMVTAEVVHQRATPVGVVAGVRWTALDPAAHRALVDVLYGDPDGWLQDRYAHDRPFTALLSVVFAPFRALLRGRLWRANARGHADSLVPETRPCVACGAKGAHLLGRCDRCGTHVPFATVEPANMRWSRPRGRSRRYAWPAALTGVGVLAVVGLIPIPGRVHTRAEISVEDRIAQLREAEAELALLTTELRARAAAGGGTPADWEERIADVRARHGLDGAGEDVPLLAHTESTLRLATFSLESAAVELRAPDRLQARLARVDDALSDVRQSLEGA